MTEEIRGRVIQAQSGFFSVEIGEKVVVCQLRGRLKKGRKLADIVAIGDWVIITEQEKLGGTLPEIRQELADVERVPKIEFDCLASVPLAERIKRLGRHVLIIAGIEAHICVSQTALHGVSDYAVHVVSDAVSSRSPHNRKVALDRMMQGGVTVSSTEMAIYELLGKAGTDTFKEVLKVVK